jgi:CheY-like chemotaxis protein
MDMGSAANTGSLEGINLLVVEDDEDTRELLKVLLQANGATVRAVGSVPEALSAYDESRPDVLIADIGMPDYNGYTLIGRVRAIDRESRGKLVPAIALTAYATAIDRDTVLSAGFQVHIAKPFEPNALVAVVADLAKKGPPASV